MFVSYKFRIYPNKKQEILIFKTFGCTRFVYNYFLDLKNKTYIEEHLTLSNYDLFKQLTKLKKEFVWLKEIDNIALRFSLIDLDRAFNNFYKTKNFPKFKKKGVKNSFRTSNNSNSIRIVENKYLKVPKIGLVKVKFHRQVKGKIKNITISRKPSGKYYVSICCECDDETTYLPKTEKRVGVDLGAHSFATLSDGTKFENLRLLEGNMKKLIKLQQSLSRKKIGSKNREKARIKLARLYERISNQKNDYLHKISKFLVTEFDEIVIEDLEVSKMLLDDGNKKSRHNINRSLLSLSMYSFRTMLEYKCNRYGKTLIIADKYYPSSQLCSDCGTKHDITKDVRIREWICPECNIKHDRDINAAINLYNYCI